MRKAPFVVVALGFASASATAWANGRFPYADQLVVDPKDPTHVVVRSTYGFLQSRDSGASFRWVCEESLSAAGEVDAAIGVMGDGTILAGVVSGLSITHDRGCSWSFAGGSLDKQYVIDVAVDGSDPMHAIAITSTAAGAPSVIMADTSDGGKTWSKTAGALPSGFDALTADPAPSNGKRVYMSGLLGDKAVGTMMRSDDRGASWTTLAIAGIGNGQPYVSAVDAKNADVLYLRVSDYSGDRLLVSVDGAKTWKEIVKATDRLLGFALSPDGTHVAVGGPKDGLLVASRSDHVFSKASSIAVKCLTWSKAGLYACANETTDGFTIGISIDSGKSFSPLHHQKLLWPASCPSSSPMATICTPLWPKTQDKIGQPRDWKPPPSWTDDAGAPTPTDPGSSDASTPSDPVSDPSDASVPRRGAGNDAEGSAKGACNLGRCSTSSPFVFVLGLLALRTRRIRKLFALAFAISIVGCLPRGESDPCHPFGEACPMERSPAGRFARALEAAWIANVETPLEVAQKPIAAKKPKAQGTPTGTHHK